jgi:hypothetical protein
MFAQLVGRTVTTVTKHETVTLSMYSRCLTLLFLCWCCELQNTNSLCPATPYSTVCYTPKGLAWYSEWGTLRNTGNAMLLATLMGKYGASAASRQQHQCWARR